MILNIDVSGKDFQVTRPSRAKIDHLGVQRADKDTNEPQWMTELVVTDDSGGEVIKVTTTGKQPDLERGDAVEVFGLVAIPWANGGKAGVAFRADSIRLADD
jgi:hypothetical protein